MILNTLHLPTFNAKFTLTELSSKFERLFCRAEASELELMVLKILVSSANVAILELLSAFVIQQEQHIVGSTPVALLMLLGVVLKLIQERLFAGIDFSDKN